MRTLLSSILVLGLSAQPILAQRILSDAEAAYAIRMGEKMCAIQLKKGTPVDVLMNQEFENIPQYIKRDSVMLEEYFKVLKFGYMNCLVENLTPENKTPDKK